MPGPAVQARVQAGRGGLEQVILSFGHDELGLVRRSAAAPSPVRA